MSPLRKLPGSIAVAATSCLLAFAVPAQAVCYAPKDQLPSQTVEDFIANPASLLMQFPNGGGALIGRVRDLAASNPMALNALIGLLSTSTPDQQKAIGTGLGQAALVCVRTDQPYATQIPQAVAASNNNNAIVAMTAVLGDQQIGAAGGGGAGGGGGGGGGGGPTTAFASGGSFGSGTPAVFGGATANTATDYFTSSSTSAGTPGTTSSTTTTTVTESVSPH